MIMMMMIVMMKWAALSRLTFYQVYLHMKTKRRWLHYQFISCDRPENKRISDLAR